MTNKLTIKYEYTGGKVILTNLKGDTYTSKSEELIDFVLTSIDKIPETWEEIFKRYEKEGKQPPTSWLEENYHTPIKK